MADLGEGPGHQTETRRAEKIIFLRDCPPRQSQGLDDRPPLLFQGLDPALLINTPRLTEYSDKCQRGLKGLFRAKIAPFIATVKPRLYGT